MKVSSRGLLYGLIVLGTSACSIQNPLPRQFVAPEFNKQEEETSKLEDLLELTKPALHTMLKGLATLLMHMYPEIGPRRPSEPPKKPKEDEPIKVFRQIMQIPSPVYQYPYNGQPQQFQPSSSQMTGPQEAYQIQNDPQAERDQQVTFPATQCSANGFNPETCHHPPYTNTVSVF